MNANEVLANRAAEILGGARGEYSRVHPNDHVNMGQSTNDVYPDGDAPRDPARCCRTCSRPRSGLADGLDDKSREFAHVLKTGRTHLQDAVPITLGQEFGGYAANVAHAAATLERTADAAARAEPRRDRRRHRAERRRRLHAARDRATSRVHGAVRCGRRANRFRVTQSMGDVLAYSGALRRLAVEVDKVASDLRLLSMGPRAGIAEIQLPPVQPGSSIMPGKVNPSVPEMVNQVCYQVYGCDATILAAADAGQLELNVMMPVIAWNALHATRILDQRDARAADALRRGHPAPTRSAAASCSIAARRWRPRSARTSATRRPPTSPRRRSQTGTLDPRARARAQAAARRRSSTRSCRRKR